MKFVGTNKDIFSIKDVGFWETSSFTPHVLINLEGSFFPPFFTHALFLSFLFASGERTITPCAEPGHQLTIPPRSPPSGRTELTGAMTFRRPLRPKLVAF